MLVDVTCSRIGTLLVRELDIISSVTTAVGLPLEYSKVIVEVYIYIYSGNSSLEIDLVWLV